MPWESLVDSSIDHLQRGYLLKFEAKQPFNSKVVLMICGHEGSGRQAAAAALICISGYHAGINPFVVLPESATEKEGGLSRRLLVENWRHWVIANVNVRTVLVSRELNAQYL